MAGEGSKRSNASRNLSIQWLQQERPDVWKEIRRIVEERFPLKRIGRKVGRLPDSLAALKGKVTPNV